MKLFQRVNAFILLLALILSMIPAGVLDLKINAAPATDVGTTFLHANYGEGTKADGVQDAAGQFTVAVGEVRLGAVWNQAALILAFNSDTPNVEKLQINGVTIDPATGIKDGSAKTKCMEYLIPFADCNITDLKSTYPVVVKLQGQFADTTVQLSFETNNYQALILDTAKNKGDVLSADKLSSGGTFTGTGNIFTKDQHTEGLMGGSTTSPMIVDFDMDITNLPLNPVHYGANKQYITAGGVNVQVIDKHCDNGKSYNVMLMKFGFFNQDGKLIMRHTANGANADVPVADSATGKFHVRVEYSYTDDVAPIGTLGAEDTVSAKYFVNGKCVLEASNVRYTLTGEENIGSTMEELVRIRPMTGCNVTVGNFSVSYDQPGRELMKDIIALGKASAVDQNKVAQVEDAYGKLSKEDQAMVDNYSALQGYEKYLSGAANYVYASFTDTALTADGKLDEAAYKKEIAVNSNLKLTAAWNGKELFLGFQGANPDVTDLKINGEKVKVTPKSGTAGLEYAIALDDLTVPDYTKEQTIVFKVGGVEWIGKLVFDSFIYDTAYPTAEVTYGAVPSPVTDKVFTSPDWTVVLDSFKTTDSAYSEDKYPHQDLFFPEMSNLVADVNKNTVVELEVKIDYLPSGAALPTASSTFARNMMKGGLNFCFNDDENQNVNASGLVQEAFWSGLYRENGNLYFIYFDATQTSKFVSVLVGDYIPGAEYALRMEYDYLENTTSKAAEGKANDAANDRVVASYYINGKLVATSAEAKLFTSNGNFLADDPRIQIQAQDLNAKASASEKTSVNVTVSKLFVSKTNDALFSDLTDVDDVIKLVESVPENLDDVTLDNATAVENALIAYEALDPAVRHLVTGYEKLEKAAEKINKLKNNYLHAVFSATKPALDGKANEAAYNRKITMGSVKFGAAWDAEKLYLFFNDTQAPAVSKLLINGKTVTLNRANSKTVGGFLEIAIPLNELDIYDLAAKHTISFQIGSQEWGGNLVLDTAVPESQGITGGKAEEGSVLSADGRSVVIKGMTKAAALTIARNEKLWTASTTAATVFEFDLDVTSLPAAKADVYEYDARYVAVGVNFLVMDELCAIDSVTGNVSQAFKFGFAKINGKVNLGHVTDRQLQFVPVDDDGTGSYRVRVEYTYADDAAKTVSAKYLVNGLLVATGVNVRVDVNTGTTSSSKAMLRAQQSAGTDVSVSNASVSHTNPDIFESLEGVPAVVQLIAKIGAVTLEKKAKVEAALNAYNALDSLAQTQVSNRQVLLDAVERLEILENSYLHAAFTYDELTLDGRLYEEAYRTNNFATDTVKLGAAWTKNYLYLGFLDESAPTVTNLKVNGKAVKLTASNSKAGAVSREVRISRSSYKLTDYQNATYTISFEVNGVYWCGTLVLDSNDYTVLTYNSLSGGAKGSSDKRSVVLNTITPDANGAYMDRDIAVYITERMRSTVKGATIVEFDFEAIKMVENCTTTATPSRFFLYGGLSLNIRDDRDVVTGEGVYGTKAFQIGFGKKNGDMKMFYWYYDVATGTNKLAAVDVVDADTYHVRAEYSYGTDGVAAAKFFVNGLFVGQCDNALSIASSYATKTLNTIHAMTKARDSEEANRVEVRFTNLSVSHPQMLILDDASAALNVDNLIEEIGNVTLDNITAITKARDAYDALTAKQKALVTKLAVLEAAEKKLQELKDERNKQFDTFIFADYIKEEITIDGIATEKEYWRCPQLLYSTTKLGVKWDFDYLYVAVRGDKAKELSALKINDVSVTDLGKLEDRMREIKIPLTKLGIRLLEFETTYPFSITVGGKTWEGQLVFDTGKYDALRPSSAMYMAKLNTAITSVDFDTTESTLDKKRVGITYSTDNLTSVSGSTTSVEFDVKVDAMPENGQIGAPGRQFADGGISITLRDDDLTLNDTGMGNEALQLGLLKLNGQMVLAFWDGSSGESGEFITVPVDDFGTRRYHIRADYLYATNDEVTAKFYVNGMLVGESYSAKQFLEEKSFGTAKENIAQVLLYGTLQENIKATFSDFSVTHPRNLEIPGPLSELDQEYLFGRQDLGHVQNDLVLPREFTNKYGETFKMNWVSSNPDLISNTGKVNRPELEPASATLTLVIDGEDILSLKVTVDPLAFEEYESPENVDAAFSASAIVIDGIISEDGWRMSGRVLDDSKTMIAEYGFQWDQTHLYLAVDYIAEVTSLSFKLNGRYFILKDGKLTRGGQNVGGSTKIAENNGVVELCIPFSVLGLSSKISTYGVSMPMSVKAGNFVGNGKILHLSGIDWFQTENRDHAALTGSIKSVDSYHGIQALGNGYRMFDLYGGSNKAEVRSLITFMSHGVYLDNLADREFDTRVEFDFQAHALPVLRTDDNSAYEIGGGAFGNSGFTCVLGDIAQGALKFSNSINFGIINTNKGLQFVLSNDNLDTVYLNKQVGDKFSIAIEWSSDDIVELYVDGVLFETFTSVTHWGRGDSNASLVFNMRPLFAPKSEADNYDISITNLALGKVHKETNLLNQVEFEDIAGKNAMQEKITSNLTLPTQITNGQLDKVYGITWTSSDPAVNAKTGEVTRPATGAIPVVLTATLPTGETKDYELIVHGKKAENDGILHVKEDLDPETGAGVTSKDLLFTLDANNNSIIKVLDGNEKINYVVLQDLDDKSRLTIETLTLWISDDNITYTRIKDFKLLNIREKWYLYDFEVEGKYVKVHFNQPLDTDACFTGVYGQMISAGYEPVFGGGDAAFTTGTYTLTNNTGKTQQDYAWTISKSALGITGTDASIRISLDGKLLYHYVSGNNVVVRVPELAAGASAVLTVQQSASKDVMDIANKEGVHEVIYGVKDTTISSSKWYFLTLPAGTVFPDGSKLEVETIYGMGRGKIQISTDGGVSWTTTKIFDNAPEGKNPVVKMGEGGWIYGSKSGRMMFENYVVIEKISPFNVDASHGHTDIIASDDGGKTWYVQQTMPCRVCMPEYFGNNNIPTYALSYSDGTEMSTADGAGPNVDYVFPVGAQVDNIGTFACYVGYSTDGGYTWHYSKTPITYPSEYGAEGGTSEAFIVERSDGILVLHVRTQEKDALHFKASYSYDKGITWTNEHVMSDYYASNGQAIIKKMNIAGENTVISAWGGQTALGGASYHRNPFNLASSSNQAETFRNIQNMTFRTFQEVYSNVLISDTTNASLVKYGEDNLLLTYRRNEHGDYVIMNIEDFDDWFTKTKGAFDDFEHGTVQYEGWHKVLNSVELSSEIAHGKYSMKLGSESQAIRSIPYLQDGTVSVDLYVPANTSFTFQLQSGHNRAYNHAEATPIAFRVENGKLYLRNDTTPVAEVKEGWNTIAFDLKLTQFKAALSVNGGKAIDIPMDIDGHDYVCFVVVDTALDDTLYLDDFMLISDTEVTLSATAEDQKAADNVVALIKAINSSGNRDAAIKAAREAFNKLTQAQKDLVDMRVPLNNGKKTIDGMINYYDQLRMAEDGEKIVTKMIDALGAVDKNSGEAIQNAEKAYRQLTSAQKNKVANYGALQLARMRYDRLIKHKKAMDTLTAEEVQLLIEKIVPSNPIRFKSQISAARSAYKMLTADQMALVNSVVLIKAEKDLVIQEEKLLVKTLASMQQLFDSLANVTLEQLALVEGARVIYNKLDAEQKQGVEELNLVRAESQMRRLKANVDRKTLNEIRLNGVINQIDSIGRVTMEKKAFIEATRASYDKLTAKQKELVKNEQVLLKAEAALTALIQTMDAIPNTGDTAGNLWMPALLVSVLALAVLIPLYRKKRFF